MIFITFRLISATWAVGFIHVKEGASAVETFLPSECQGARGPGNPPGMVIPAE